MVSFIKAIFSRHHGDHFELHWSKREVSYGFKVNGNGAEPQGRSEPGTRRTPGLWVSHSSSAILIWSELLLQWRLRMPCPITRSSYFPASPPERNWDTVSLVRRTKSIGRVIVQAWVSGTNQNPSTVDREQGTILDDFPIATQEGKILIL